MKLIIITASVLIVLLLTACESTPVPTTQPMETPVPTIPTTGTPVSPTFTPQPTITATPEPTATAVPTATNVPTGSPTAPNIPTATPEYQIFRDDFNGALQQGWTWENERTNHWTITPDGWLQILGEDTGLLYGQAQSNLLWRELPSGNYAIIVHLKAVPVANFQQATIYLYEDIENYIPLNRGYCGPCSTGGNGIYMVYKINGLGNAYSVAFQETDLYLKLESKDNVISGYYATVPDQWQRVGRFGNYFVFKRVGLGVTNNDMEGDDSADLTGRFDYFEIIIP